MVWGRLEDRRDQLRLLALVAQGLGADGLSEYEPPSAALVTGLAELADEDEPLDRAGEVERFVAQAGGEAG